MLGLFALFIAPAAARAFDHEHTDFTSVLGAVVSDKRIDYAALKKDPVGLDAYLKTLAAVSESGFQSWSKDEQLAYLINLYNAATIKLVVDHYPVKSIKDIGGLFSGPWKQEVVDLFGEKVTLDHIEHGIVRVNYTEPRAHFGLVCASIGCPPLRAGAFSATKLGAQLDEQGRVFFAEKTKNRVEGGVLYLSPIFDWFAGDFTKKGGTIEAFVAPYFSDEVDRRAVAAGGLKVKFTDYDWSLNRQ